MKLLLLLPLLALSGCVTSPQSHLKQIPPGTYSTVRATVTGKFSSTTFEGDNVVIGADGSYQSGHLKLQHSNIYVPRIELELDKPASLFPPLPLWHLDSGSHVLEVTR